MALDDDSVLQAITIGPQMHPYNVGTINLKNKSSLSSTASRASPVVDFDKQEFTLPLLGDLGGGFLDGTMEDSPDSLKPPTPPPKPAASPTFQIPDFDVSLSCYPLI